MDTQKSLADKYGTRLVWMIFIAVVLLVTVYYLV